jgi:hypothetical protein
MSRARLLLGLGPLLVGCAICGCRGEPEPAPPANIAATPDRLAPGEGLPESETAFGLAMPRGMRLVSHFKDAAYFAGDVELERVLEHVAQHVSPRDAQLVDGGASFPSVRIDGDASGRLLRITLRKTRRGSQIHIEDVTPSAPVLSGLSQEEVWRKAGRKPDGTPLDPNQLY